VRNLLMFLMNALIGSRKTSRLKTERSNTWLSAFRGGL
jgi:hypothetical protein